MRDDGIDAFWCETPRAPYRPWDGARDGGMGRLQRIGEEAMHIEVSDTRLWFDVDGSGLVPDGSEMRQRPTVVLVHGGPATYDSSYPSAEIEPPEEKAPATRSSVVPGCRSRTKMSSASVNERHVAPQTSTCRGRH